MNPRAPFPYQCRSPCGEKVNQYIQSGLHPVHVGDILHEGRYRILQKLGKGSFSTVWAAQD
ncbi:hypothetical protein K470DRAFT_210964 [Piedraia hortae CBS 480.64]|uniref:non-specific serine/threonine protein kinase n=1 Tax=Piedraia hortae CBS 480.64 TaxID=1314780 RepID=A0A6A7C7T7_9PEZI|nr:hypothetical protein K470DRAFT_210964 [Piedraia hortae CBS 480.64]